MDTATVARFTSAQADAALIAGLFSLVTLALGIVVTHFRLRSELRTDQARAEYTADLDRRLEDHKRELQLAIEKARTDWEAAKPRQDLVRDHLTVTRQLLGRVNVSFSRLAGLAPALAGEDTLTEVTNTLDLYAEYRHHLSASEYVSYPSDLKGTLRDVQRALSAIFLELHFAETEADVKGEASPRMRSSLDALKSHAATAVQQIEDLIRVKITRLDGDA